MLKLALAAIVLLACSQAQADCELRSAALREFEKQKDGAFPGLADRFLEECRRFNGDIYVLAEPDLASRLVRPRGLTVTFESLSYRPSTPDAQSAPRWPGIIYVVEPDGRIRDIRVSRSSGDRAIDVAAVRTFRKGRWRSVATLDGKPVRLLYIHAVKYVDVTAR